MSNFLTDLFGSKPSLPSWTSLNLGTEQQKALTENLAAAPKATQLANLTEQQLLSMMRTTFPNFDEVSKTISANTLSELKGEIPKDVQESIQRSTVGQSLWSTGASGLQLGGTTADELGRNLGISSYELTKQGLASAESWLKASEQLLAPAAQVYTSMFVTPGQQAGFDVNERNMQFEHDWLGAQIAAMPDPTTVGLWNASWSVVDSVLSAYTGGNFSGMGQIKNQPQQYPGMGSGSAGTSIYGNDPATGGATPYSWGGNTRESINIYNDPSQSGGSFTDIAATGG